MFIPGIFIWGDALGEAAGIGMLCMCGVGDGDAFGAGVGEAIGFDPPADAGGSDFGVGDGIGIVCWCCPRAEAINNNTNNEVSTIRVSGWVRDATERFLSDMSKTGRDLKKQRPRPERKKKRITYRSSCLSCCMNRHSSSIRVCLQTN